MTSKWKTDSFIRTGLRHKEESQPCQDYVKIIHYPNGDIYGSLGDGISSAENSELASKTCVTVGGDVLQKIFIEDKAVCELSAAHGKKADHMLEEISDLLTQHIQESLADIPCADTTYAFVYIIRGRYALVGYIGDSCVCVFSNGKATALTQTRDYGGATESIRHPDASRLLELHLINLSECKIDAFLLTSDGMEDVLYTKGDEGHVLYASQHYINSIFENQGHEMIEDMIGEVCADGCYDDDISLVLLARNKVTVPEDPTWLCSCGARNSLNTAFCDHCGSDVLELYKDAPMKEFKSLWDYFSYLNTHPEEERTTVGLPKLPHDIDMTPNVRLLESRRGKHNNRFDATEERAPLHQEKKRIVNNNRKSKRRNRLPARLAVAGAAALILMGGMTTVAFFQSLSISHSIEEMQGEIDSLRDEISVLRMELHMATPSGTEPTASTTQESYLSTQPTTVDENMQNRNYRMTESMTIGDEEANE